MAALSIHPGRPLRAVARAPGKTARLLLRSLRGLLPFLPAAVGVAGAAALVVADQTTVHSVRVLTVTLDRVSGGERHHHLLLIGGVVAVVLVVLAVLRASRLPGLGLLALAVGAALLALVGDIPSANDPGHFGLLYKGAHGQAGPGQTLELVGAGLLGLSGLAILARGGRPARRSG